MARKKKAPKPLPTIWHASDDLWASVEQVVQTPFLSQVRRIGSRPDRHVVGAGNAPAPCSAFHFSANSFGVRYPRLLCGRRSL